MKLIGILAFGGLASAAVAIAAVVTGDGLGSAPPAVAGTHDSAVTSVNDGPRVLADWLPNTKWRHEYASEARSSSDLAVIATVVDARAGVVTSGPNAIDAPTSTIVFTLKPERGLGNRPDSLPGQIVVEMTVASPADGPPDIGGLLAAHENRRGLWLLVRDTSSARNPGVDAVVFWSCAIAADGTLVSAATGDLISPRVTRGLRTIDDVEREARRPDREVTAAERRRDPSYYGDVD
jgi:hypothetical protein